MVYGTEEAGGLLHYERRDANPILARYLERRAHTVGAIEAVDDLLPVLPVEALEVGTIDETDRVRALRDDLLAELDGRVKIVMTETLLDRRRYRWAEDTLSRDFAGFGDLDLSGFEVTGGFAIRF